MADCSKCGIRPPETHGRRQWTTVYVGSPAAWMTTTADWFYIDVFTNSIGLIIIIIIIIIIN